jgi:hypothetical protein
MVLYEFFVARRARPVSLTARVQPQAGRRVLRPKLKIAIERGCCVHATVRFE